MLPIRRLFDCFLAVRGVTARKSRWSKENVVVLNERGLSTRDRSHFDPSFGFLDLATGTPKISAKRGRNPRNIFFFESGKSVPRNPFASPPILHIWIKTPSFPVENGLYSANLQRKLPILGHLY